MNGIQWLAAAVCAAFLLGAVRYGALALARHDVERAWARVHAERAEREGRGAGGEVQP